MLVALLLWLWLRLAPPGWPPPPVADQHGAPQCVAYALLAWEETAPGPVAPAQLPAPPALYGWAQARDGLPAGHTGTFVAAGWAALAAAGWIVPGSVRTTRDAGTAVAWLAAGPIVVEADWYASMWASPGAGLLPVVVAPQPARHAWACYGAEAAGTVALCQQSWGAGWGAGGRFRLRTADLAVLLAHAGTVSQATKRWPGWPPRLPQ